MAVTAVLVDTDRVEHVTFAPTSNARFYSLARNNGALLYP